MAYKAKKKTNLGTKIFVWFMFGAMLLSFLTTLIYYVLIAKGQ